MITSRGFRGWAVAWGMVLVGILSSGCKDDSGSTIVDPPPVGTRNSIDSLYVNALSVGPSGKLYAATLKGLFYSSDGGESWFSGGPSVEGRDINCAIETPSGTMFAGSGGCAPSVGIMRSLDHGASWVRCDTGLTSTCLTTFAWKTGGTLFAGTGSAGIFRSTNNGDSWVSATAGIGTAGIDWIEVLGNGELLAGTLDGMYRSTNNGDLWNLVGQDSVSRVFEIQQVSDGRIFACYSNGLQYAESPSTSWTPAPTGLGTVYHVDEYAAGKVLAFGLPVPGMVRSTDNGASWQPGSWTDNANMITSIVHRADGTIFLGTYRSIFRSTDQGTTWQRSGP